MERGGFKASKTTGGYCSNGATEISLDGNVAQTCARTKYARDSLYKTHFDGKWGLFDTVLGGGQGLQVA